MNNVRDRILVFIDAIGITKSRFEKIVGFSNGYIDKLRECPSQKKLDIISNTFPMLSMPWLLTGEGEMLKDESISQNAYGDNNQIAGRDINNGVRGNTTNTTTNNTTNNYKDCGACETSLLEKAIDEMGEQRKQFAEQINRLLAIIEKMNDR